MLTEEQSNDIEFCRTFIIAKIKNIVETADKIKEHISPEVMVSIIHIKILSDYLKDKKFESIEEVWVFMRDDMKSIVEKISYAGHNLTNRIQNA